MTGTTRETIRDGQLVVSQSGGFDKKVFYVAHGRRRHVPCPEWLAAHQYTQKDILRVSDDVISALKIGPYTPMLIPAAELVTPPMDLHPFAMRAVVTAHLRGKGYEFGAGPRPIPIPVEAAVTYVDQFDYSHTVDGGSYAAFANDMSDFVEIDLIDSLDRMDNIADQSADFIIASHVIEHVRDPIGVLKNAHQKLARGGSLVLVVPDKERIFDLPRPTTTLDHLLADHLQPSRDRDFEHYLEWNRVVKRLENYEEATREDFLANRDIHYHTFTFTSFDELVHALADQAAWSEVRGYPCRVSPEAIEFYFVLVK